MSDIKHGAHQTYYSPEGPEVRQDDGLHPVYEVNQSYPVHNDGYAQYSMPSGAISQEKPTKMIAGMKSTIFYLVSTIAVLLSLIIIGLIVGLAVALSNLKNASLSPTPTSSQNTNATMAPSAITSLSATSTVVPVTSCPDANGTVFRSPVSNSGLVTDRAAIFNYTIHCNSTFPSGPRVNVAVTQVDSLVHCATYCDSIAVGSLVNGLGISGISALYRVNAGGTDEFDGDCWCVRDSAASNNLTFTPSRLDTAIISNSSIT